MRDSQAGQRDADDELTATEDNLAADAVEPERGDLDIEDDLAEGDLGDADGSDDSDDDSADDGEDIEDEVASGLEDAEADGGDSDREGAAPATSGDGVGRLEREGDIAADYLEELLDIADFDGDIDLDVENDRAMVSIVGSGLGNLVGQRGATLDALQDLTRLAVLRVTGERSRLMLDIAGTRARRKQQLHQVGTEAAERARSSGEPVRLDPMTPFERKVVHDAVAEAGLRSESDGVEPNRRVVVYPS